MDVLGAQDCAWHKIQENDDTHVTINAGKKPLKDILDKMPNVLYLSIRGTLLPEDYIFLKENCMG